MRIASVLVPVVGAFLSATVLPGIVDAADGVVFTDVTDSAGIHFRHSFGDEEMSSILEATGSGCLFLDFDRDGLMDLYAVNGSYLPGISEPEEEPDLSLTNHLFRNRDGLHFADVTAASGAGDPGYGMAGVAGDYDGDGWPDLYVTNYGPNALYRNGGDGTFANTTAAAGVGDTLWGVGTTFLDYDNDGDLDLFVGNYLEFDPEYQLYYAADNFPGPLSYPGQRDVLYRNEGDGTFADVTAAAGVLNEGRAMGVVAADYDGDGRTDLFVANDAMGNYLYRNRGDGAFEDVALLSGVAFSSSGDKSSSMGGDFGDFDGDGDFDLLVPDMAYNNLYVNTGGGQFDDATAALGIAEVSGQYVSWSGDFFDLDNDADLDMFITNGDAHHLEHTQEALLLANEPAPGGGRRFTDVSGESGAFFYVRCVSRGAASGDYDNDGDLDLFVLHLDQPSMLLRNDGGNANHWLQVHLQGTRSNGDAFGTRLRLSAGGRAQTAEKLSASGYLAQNDPRVHFGVGAAAVVDTLEVWWPSGARQVLTGVAADQMLTIREPAQ